MTEKIVVIVTCASGREAKRIARTLIDRGLAACANIFPGKVESIYRWRGKIQSAKETILFIKTSRKKFRALQKEVQSLHGYDVPEIIALPIDAGSRDYLQWISDSVATSKE